MMKAFLIFASGGCYGETFSFLGLVAGLAVLSVVALACRVSLSPASSGGRPPQAQPTSTAAVDSSTLPVGEPSPLPAALPPPMFPIVLPTPIFTCMPSPGLGVVFPRLCRHASLRCAQGDRRRGLGFLLGRYQGSAGKALYSTGG